MNIKRAFLALAAALMLPGLAMAGVSSPATFEVDFDFDDGNDETSATLYHQCNGGLPLNQNTVVFDGDTNTFVLQFSGAGDGDYDCRVWVGDVPGYSATYECDDDDGMNCHDHTDDGSDLGHDDDGIYGCFYDSVDPGDEHGENNDSDGCEVVMYADLVAVTVTKDWEVLGSSPSNLIPQDVDVVIKCNNYIEGWTGTKGDIFKKRFEDVTTDTDLVAMVSPDWEGTECWAEEKLYDSRIEIDNDCGTKGNPEMEVFPGTTDSCTITNTLFFEGIPTLNQYGLAIMALLMLGVGFVGFRRFV